MVLLHAIATAFLVSLPLILFPLLAGAEYAGINFLSFGTDQQFYLSRGREVLDGNGLGNSILRDGKDNPDPFSTMNERVLLAPYQWLGVGEKINVATLYTVMNMVGIAILVLLIYALAYQLTEDKFVSSLIGVSVIAGSSIVFTHHLFSQDPNIYGRAMTPYLSSIALFAFLNALVRTMVKPKIKTQILATLLFGALFYVYLFAWTYALVLSGVLFLVSLCVKKRKEAIRVLYMTLGGLVLGVPTLIRLATSLFVHPDRSLSYFEFLEHSRAPLFSIVGAVLLVLFAVSVWKKRNDERFPFLFAIILSGWIVLNQQLITGIRLQPGHYYWYFVVPLGIVVALVLLWLLAPRRWRMWGCAALFFVMYVSMGGSQYLAANATKSRLLEEQRFRPMLDALNAELSPTVVFAAPNDHAFLYIVYTHDDLLWHDAATLYHGDPERMTDMIVVMMLMNRDARQDALGFLHRMAAYDIEPRYYADMYHTLEGFTTGLDYAAYRRQVDTNDSALLPHREELITTIASKFMEALHDQNGLTSRLQAYGVSYLVWDEASDPAWDVSLVPGLVEIKTDGQLHLYRVEGETSDVR